MNEKERKNINGALRNTRKLSLHFFTKSKSLSIQLKYDFPCLPLPKQNTE